MKAEEFKTTIVSLTNKLYRVALRLLGNHSDARDAVQDILVKAWNMRERLMEINNREAFMTTMIKNHCLDKLRTTHTIPSDLENLRHYSGSADSVEEQLIREDTGKVIRKLIQNLPEQQKEIMVMRDLEGMEFEEIQMVTNTNLNHIRVNLSRARKSVREELLKLFNYEKYVLESFRIK